ncbi:MAG: DUF4173 domain-containing protein [Arcicella sp.]|nr:DUF4173 domain-containing protein [Arcicella sp.]
MKLKNIFLFFAIVAYSCLFYQQTAGINFLIFNGFLLTFSGVINPTLLRNRNWQISALGAFLTALMIVWHHSQLAIIAHIASMILVIGFTYSPVSSVYVSALHGLLSMVIPYFTHTIKYLIDLTDSKAPKSKGVFSFKTASVYIIPLTITLVFYALYASANPVFADLIKIPKINISLSLISFTFVGWIMLTGFFNPFGNEETLKWDASKTDILTRIKLKMKQNFDFIALKLENKKGVILLVMLNALLLFYLIFDFSFILSGKKLPDGMDYSKYVHEGVNTLIFSILLAIGIILYYFRANQNFYVKNQLLVRLTYVWIFQNGLLLLGIIHKNQIYIDQYGLTYKRIGVYVYLLMTLAGLITTFWKVKELKTIWFLLRKNVWITYTVLIISSLINWDRMIAKYNINVAQVTDVVYLMNLSDTVLPELQSLLNNPKVDLSTQIRDYTEYSSTPIFSQREFIDNQLLKFKNKYQKKDWQSWNYDDKRVFEEIKLGGI